LKLASQPPTKQPELEIDVKQMVLSRTSRKKEYFGVGWAILDGEEDQMLAFLQVRDKCTYNACSVITDR
jgi:hypothetical protein